MSSDPITEKLASADVEKGRTSALECGVCHQLAQNQASIGSGPRLWGIVGRPIASEVFGYSDALQAETGTWTFERLNAFLADPAGTVPGSLMYRGYVRDPIVRINLIAYLRTLSESPVPLP